MNRKDEHREKLRRLRAAMRAAGLDVAFLTTRANFAWLTGGAQNYVNTGQPTGVATLAVTARKAYVLASAIEGPRMMAEELDADAFTLVEFPWHCDAAKRAAVMDLAEGKLAATDAELCGLPPLPPELAELRYSLMPQEITRYKRLGREVSEILEAVGAEIEPGMRERDVEGMMAALAMAMGMRPFVRLVAADTRINRFRHPIPTDRKIGKRVMFVLVAERQGLCVAATRLVSFAPLSKSMRRKHDAVCRIDAALIGATVPGTAVGDVLGAGIDAYEREGFGSEWQLHHQGGPTGYLGREFIATPGERRLVHSNQAFAWNPSITGTKCEDTILATEAGPVLLSHPIDWPVIEVETPWGHMPRADILVR